MTNCRCGHPKDYHGYPYSKKTGCIHPNFTNGEIEICPCKRYVKGN